MCAACFCRHMWPPLVLQYLPETREHWFASTSLEGEAPPSYTLNPSTFVMMINPGVVNRLRSHCWGC